MSDKLKSSYRGRMMIGQAGVFRVMSELLMRGHVPSVPSVDTGIDVLLDNGVRIQVKSTHLRSHPHYPEKVYHFSVRDSNGEQRIRNWSKVVDFLIFWAIDEDRFFVTPSHEAVQNFWINPRSVSHHRVDSGAIRMLREKGMTYGEITDQLGCSRGVVANALLRPDKEKPIRGNRHLASYEDRWDLLDVNKALASVEVASAETSEVNRA